MRSPTACILGILAMCICGCVKPWQTASQETGTAFIQQTGTQEKSTAKFRAPGGLDAMMKPFRSAEVVSEDPFLGVSGGVASE